MNTTTATETETGTEAQPTVADTILRQIDATDRWARARWGVKLALAEGEGLQFNCTRGIRVIVKLDAATDTYAVEVGRLRGMKYTARGFMSMVYADQLVRIVDSLFSKAFGLL